MEVRQKIAPCLWYDDAALEAAELYVSLFDGSEILSVSHYGEGGPRPAGSVMVVSFRLAGQEFMALNGGPEFLFTEAVSLYVHCATQDEVDYLWERLTADGGQESMCGWLKDKYGLSWQIVPDALTELMGDADRERAGRVVQAMLQMRKIDVAALRRAYDG